MSPDELPSKTAAPDLSITTQYIKELYVKIPNSPYIFNIIPKSPELIVKVDVNANQLNQNSPDFEVVTSISCSSMFTNEDKAKDTQICIFEIVLKYGAITSLNNLNHPQFEELLMVETPTLVFPEMRNIILNISRESNLPPIFLQRINFRNLYEKRKQTNNS
ncbi:Protein-export protein SecB [Commensalibacter sp. Nvir]|uniref:protein-export chaperone SecB n=1 Tax=Commensalibacter sp. Nvir TaxID=3069817 RepID=UPI002D271D00|nr:Protein-export protein SecB [Commensalibacter sp. Nvir]